MSVSSKTATAVIALMIAGAYPIAGMAQTQTQTETQTETQVQTETQPGTQEVQVEVIEAEEGAEATGETLEQSASEAGQAIGQAAEQTGEVIEQGAQAVGEAVEEGVSEAAETVDQATGTTVEVIEEGAEGADSVEVIEAEVDETEDLDEAQMQELEQAAAEGKPVPPTEMIMGVQQDGQWLSSELLDQEVRNPEGEVIGDIGAILFSDHGPDGVIVEVGGFLGIGEKDVAIKWGELAMSEDGIVVNATEEQLKNAPDFVSLEEQQAQAELEAQQELTEQEGMMTSGTAGTVAEPIAAEPEVEVESEPAEGEVEVEVEKTQ